MKKSLLVAIAVVSVGAISGPASAREGADFFREARESRNSQPAAPEIVKWTGLVKCEEGSHLTPHDCDLKFVRDDGKTFSIVDSDALKKEHCKTNADLKVEVTGEITPQFLFWGGNLAVQNYKVIETQGEKVCDLAYARDREARRVRIVNMERR